MSSGGKVRKFSQEFFLSHASGKILQDVGDRIPCAADARFTAPLVRLDCYNLPIIHERIISQTKPAGEHLK